MLIFMYAHCLQELVMSLLVSTAFRQQHYLNSKLFFYDFKSLDSKSVTLSLLGSFLQDQEISYRRTYWLRVSFI